MAIFRNDVTVFGNVKKVKHFEGKKVTRVSVDVPFKKKDGTKGSHTIDVDAKGDKAAEVAEGVKEGGVILIKALMLKRKCRPDGKDKDYHVLCLQMDDYKGFRFIPDSSVEEGVCEVVYAGRVMQTPELKKADTDNPFCHLNVVYNRPGSKKDEEKGTFIDVGVFGASAEKFVTKYIKEGDFVIVEGSLSPRKESFTVREKEIWSLRLNAAPFAGVQSVTPTKSGGGGGGGVASTDDSFYDDDLPF